MRVCLLKLQDYTPVKSLFLIARSLLFLLAGLPTAARAGALIGDVRHAQTGVPLRGASVVVAALDRGAQADSVGVFEIEAIPPGAYTVRVSHVGFRPVIREGVRVAGDEPTVLRLRLAPEAIPLEALVVVAQPVGAADIHRSPSFVTVVTREAFEGRVTSVPEVLAASTGVQVKRLGGLGSFSTISVRGCSAEQVEVYLDGILLNSALGGGVNLSNLPLAQVAQIEVYRGAAAEGGGMGGTVHIRTQASEKGLQLGGSASWGSLDSRGLNVMVSDRRGRAGYLVVADYSASDNDFRFLDDNGTEYNPDDDEWTARRNSDVASGSALGKWTCRFRENWQVYAQENLYWKHHGIPGIGNNQSMHARFDTFRSLTEVGLVIPDWLNRFSLRQTAFFSHQGEAYADRQGEVGLGRQDNHYVTRAYGFDGRLQWAPSGGSASALGVSASREAFRPEARLGGQGTSLESSRWTASARAAVDWMLPWRLGVVSASATLARQQSHIFEENPYIFSPLAPDTTTDRTLIGLRAGVRLDVAPGVWLKANLGQSRRGPSFQELFGNRGGAIGNTALQPERGVTWDAGLRVQAQQRGALEVAYFDHRYQDLIQFVQFSQGISRAQNIGEARVRGLETTLSLTVWGGWRVSGNYTYQKAVDRSPFAHRRGKLLPNRPVHTLDAHTEWTLWRGTFFYDYAFEARTYLDRANLRPVAARHIHNAGVRLAVYRDARLAFEAKNLRDSQVADLWGYPLPGRSYFVTLKDSF